MAEKTQAPTPSQTQQAQIEDQLVKINGTDHRFGDLPKEIQEMVAILSRWNMELMEKRIETVKIEHALKSMTNEISKAMKQKSSPAAMEIGSSE